MRYNTSGPKRLGFYLSMFLFASLSSCSDKDGEELAKTHCSSCHVYTGPEMLDKTSWKAVLPEMAFRMGLVNYGLAGKNFDELSDALLTLPDQPMVTEEQYKLISDYFISHAPDSLAKSPINPTTELSQFEVKEVRLSSSLPFVCMVKQDSSKRIFVGGRDRSLLVLNKDFTIGNSFTLDSPPSYVVSSDEDNLLCLEMGIMDPNDKHMGSLVSLNLKTRKSNTLIDSLMRPVYFEGEDLNDDQRLDFVICEFGNYAGKIEAFETLSDGTYKVHLIEASPGSRKIIVKDFNNDGRPDILALLSQGNERINLYTNEGNFNFRVSTLLAFPAVYGASYFEIHDFNKDGFFDILMTNGDNADYSKIFKPYHGVRLFLNDGKNKFNEKWFYPINGASWAVARDFDEDGDLDIAAITFFPNYKSNPQESFVYFENNNLAFKPYSIPGLPAGRWLVMEAADVDDDKDIDIILGALDFKPGDEKLLDVWKKNPVGLLVLKNKLRQ